MPTAPAANGSRRRALLGLSLLVLLAAVGWGAYWYLYERHYESTDNAYVSGNLVQVTPQIAGTIVRINADETDFVRAGDTVIELDPADARLALEQAQAQLAQTVREVRTLFATSASFDAAVAQRDAEVARARSSAAKAAEDLARRQALASSGAVSAEEVQHAATALADANSALAAAQAAAAAAREQAAANRAQIAGTTVATHPAVRRAAEGVREAWLALTRVVLPAPVSGHVAKRSAQVGMRVQPGTPLMAVVPLDRLWVEANFKEVQLRDMRIGQPVRLSADLYGSGVEFHGRIEGLGVGTGAAFALLPAQNATGNWIKVVQRVPVRIALDPADLAAHPLRVGLSMQARVDVADRSGPMLAQVPPTQAAAATTAFAPDTAQADALIERIIAANLGAGSAHARRDERSRGQPAAVRSQPAAPGAAAKAARGERGAGAGARGH